MVDLTQAVQKLSDQELQMIGAGMKAGKEVGEENGHTSLSEWHAVIFSMLGAEYRQRRGKPTIDPATEESVREATAALRMTELDLLIGGLIAQRHQLPKGEPPRLFFDTLYMMLENEKLDRMD
ncbi:hypothetical protein [Nitrolancea hollandica]|nr:hypothetical protein [Nitrolancea hollandica]